MCSCRPNVQSLAAPQTTGILADDGEKISRRLSFIVYYYYVCSRAEAYPIMCVFCHLADTTGTIRPFSQSQSNFGPRGGNSGTMSRSAKGSLRPGPMKLFNLFVRDFGPFSANKNQDTGSSTKTERAAHENDSAQPSLRRCDACDLGGVVAGLGRALGGLGGPRAALSDCSMICPSRPVLASAAN